jgi:predicted metalloprotease
MRWSAGGRSSNLEDRRGESAGGGGFGFGRGMGIGGTVILLILSLIFGRDFISGGGGDYTGASPDSTATAGGEVAPAETSPAEERAVDFTSAVLDSVQNTWQRVLPQQTGVAYRDAKLDLYRDAIRTGCGTAPSSVGPFYCPMDQKVYLDLSFYDELRQRFGAPGDFAEAYVIAHELGHHVQHLLGTDEKVRRLQQAHPELANQLSVRLELQADCYAGVWAKSDQNVLEPGDIDEALTAASAVGDDRLQRAETGTVNPDTFTHGTAAQRSAWFKRGFDSGDVKACDTFSGS